MSIRQAKRAALTITTTVWILTIVAYAATTRWTFELTSKPPVTPGVRWNNFWLSSGRFAWSRYDPAQSPYPVQYQPPNLRVRVSRDHSNYWFWKIYIVRQYGGHFAGVPLWIPLAGLIPLGPGPATILGLKAWRRRRCVTKRRCPSCEYPIEGLPTQICPECGQSVEILG